MRFVHGHNGRKANLWTEEDLGYSTPCWIGGQAKRYVRTKREGRLVNLHRYHYEQKFGPVPAGLQLDHLCCQTLCVNPDHLEVVTQAENSRRASRLTHTDVAEIRAEGVRLQRAGMRRAPGSRQAVAARFNVSVETIRNIWSGRVWA